MNPPVPAAIAGFPVPILESLGWVLLLFIVVIALRGIARGRLLGDRLADLTPRTRWFWLFCVAVGAIGMAIGYVDNPRPSRLGFLLFLVAWTAATPVLRRVEIRQRGIFLFGEIVLWGSLKSYSWGKFGEDTVLRIHRRGFWGFLPAVTLPVAPEAKKSIEELVAERLSGPADR